MVRLKFIEEKPLSNELPMKAIKAKNLGLRKGFSSENSRTCNAICVETSRLSHIQLQNNRLRRLKGKLKPNKEYPMILRRMFIEQIRS